MKKTDKLEEYEVFYMEIPQADYMEDIEIQDAYDASAYDQVQGLSDQQVSEIAKDSLDAAKRQSQSGGVEGTNDDITQ
jgi:hypothetical protein